jgi:hypothetical protein
MLISMQGQNSNAVKLNLFGLAVGQVQLAYEMALNENSSVQLSAGFVSRTWDVTLGENGADQKDNGFIIIPEYRYYFDEQLKGLYAGAFFRYKGVTSTVGTSGSNSDDSETEYTRNVVGGGALVGYQFLVSDKLVLDLFTGPQYKSISQSVKTGDEIDNFSFEGEGDGIGLRFGFNVGFAF